MALAGSIEATTPMLQTTEANTGGQLVKRKKRSEPINVYNMIRNRRSTNTTQKCERNSVIRASLRQPCSS